MSILLLNICFLEEILSSNFPYKYTTFRRIKLKYFIGKMN